MKLKPYRNRSALITLLAVACLAISLTFTVARLFDLERELRNEDTYTNLWLISQTQFEATLFADSLTRYAHDEAFPDAEQTPSFRLSILISRLGILFEGAVGRTIERLELIGGLKEAYLHLTMAEPLLESGLDRQSALLLRSQARDLA